MPREIALKARRERPSDYWPRGRGHVVLGMPSASRDEKGYLEPGGSFSPGFASLGLSLWIYDEDGRFIATSDTLPLAETKQRFVWFDAEGLPAIETETPHYILTWRATGLRRFSAQILLKPNRRVSLIVRSVGPAGGAITSLSAEERLIINRRFTLSVDPRPISVIVGHEGPPGWDALRSTLTAWQGHTGWGHARIYLKLDTKKFNVLIEDNQASVAELRKGGSRVKAAFAVPDKEWTEGVHAQVAHLVMGITGRETRAGDPNHILTQDTRDAAAIIVALARAGQTDLARDLCVPIAERDDLGDQGPHKELRGLTLWALVETAFYVDQTDFERYLWPHVKRKAEALMGGDEPARNARSVRAADALGLTRAARLAERRGSAAEAARWRDRARSLRSPWGADDSTAANDLSLLTALWPTASVDGDRDALIQALTARYEARHDHAGAYLATPASARDELLEAHQWLLLGRGERAYRTLQALWSLSPVPGLAALWGDEPGLGRWEKSRGFLEAPFVMPHYGAAAEALLLALDSLVAVDETASEPTLVVGAGVPREWLSQNVGVSGWRTRYGQVSFYARKDQLSVTVAGPKCTVRPGPAFDARAMKVTFTGR
ncbi:MAG: hypothetical protein MUF51_04335 [Vicinamibacteria bacterium]|jgi:hypothetical protein|nr:hypothetical protein [Vicinamibacteria bacterium]